MNAGNFFLEIYIEEPLTVFEAGTLIALKYLVATYHLCNFIDNTVESTVYTSQSSVLLRDSSYKLLGNRI